MPRIQPVQSESANAQQSDILSIIKKKMGIVPNILATMVQSPAVANAYLGFNQALAGGTLSAKLREQIALAVGESNKCEYCLAAHTALGSKAGLSESEVDSARRGTSADAKIEAALAFANKLVEARGFVSDADVEAVRGIGYSDGEIAEIVANVSLNIFTNYFNHVAETEVDFPRVPALS